VNLTGKGGFKPGVSGNPGGRPSAKVELREICRLHCPAAIEELARLSLKARSERTRLKAIEILFERAFGPPCRWIDSSPFPLDLDIEFPA
jgi:hypothetical protein